MDSFKKDLEHLDKADTLLKEAIVEISKTGDFGVLPRLTRKIGEIRNAIYDEIEETKRWMEE